MHPAKTSQPTPSSRNLEDILKSPTHLFLNKSIAQKGSSISVNELGPPPTPSASIRAQIGHLLPRRANFRAHIQIHQISSVPFMSGEFGVRWKFKGVQSSSTSKKGLLGRVKVKTKNSKDDQGKGRDFDGEWHAGTSNRGLVHPSMVILTHQVAGHPVSSTSLGSVENGAHTPSHVSSSSQPTLHWADSSSTSHFFDSVSSNTSHVTMVPDSNLTESLDPLPAVSTSVPVTLRRGTTPFLKLRDHSVTWSHTLDTLLKFDIDRETYMIQPNPLKLVVMQRVIPDHPGGPPQNPRLGAVYLNLAEYIGKGSVERKYLLKESKTNAVLKLTIELEYISGEATYIAPVLPKGEISNGIAELLGDGGVRKRPRALNLFGLQGEVEMDLLGTTTAKSDRFPKSARSQRGLDRKPSDGTTTPMESDSEEETYYTDDPDGVDVLFDIHRLPHAYGTKTTETIIEALFNPIKITDKKFETPFTIYEPDVLTEATKKSIGLGLSGVVLAHDATKSKRQNSLTQDTGSLFYHYSTGSSSTSLHTTTSTMSSSKKESGRHLESQPSRRIAEVLNVGESVGDTTAIATTTTFRGVKGWWRKHHPETPTNCR